LGAKLSVYGLGFGGTYLGFGAWVQGFGARVLDAVGFWGLTAADCNVQVCADCNL
jgi:hypothetical protein